MNEQTGERHNPKPKLDTIVSEAVEIAQNFDAGRAIAYIVEKTEPTEERYMALSTFAHAFRPRVMSRAKRLRGKGMSVEEFRQHKATTQIGEKAVRTVFDDSSAEQPQ